MVAIRFIVFYISRRIVVGTILLLWSHLGLNQGPPDYEESPKIQGFRGGKDRLLQFCYKFCQWVIIIMYPRYACGRISGFST